MPGSCSTWTALPGSSGSIENGAIWNWASGRSSSGRVLKNPTMSNEGTASGPRRVVWYSSAAASWPASVLSSLLYPRSSASRNCSMNARCSRSRAPTFGLSTSTSTPTDRSAAGPMPESWRILGVAMLPVARITSRAAWASKVCPFWRPRTPTARPPASTTWSTTVHSATVRLGRSMTGWRNALAALTRWPSRIVAIA